MSNSFFAMLVTVVQLVLAIINNPTPAGGMLTAILFLGTIIAYSADSIIKEIRRIK
jgi:hypothetical protein